MLEPERNLINQSARQMVEAPIHVVGAGAAAAIDAAFHPEASALSIITEPAGAMAKASVDETEKLAARTFCYAAAVRSEQRTALQG
jgi:hypothetical protein